MKSTEDPPKLANFGLDKDCRILYNYIESSTYTEERQGKMASRPLVQLEPETMRLYAFTVEAVTNELEKNLLDPQKLNGALSAAVPDESQRNEVLQVLARVFDPRPTISSRPAADILRDLAANMRLGADKAEQEFTQRQAGREERKQRRQLRQPAAPGTRKGRDFGGEDFPGSDEFFGNAGFKGAGGGQAPPSPPGVPPIASAAPAQGTTLPSQGPELATSSQAPAPPAGVPVADKDFVDDSIA